jgi:hypothetical protein
MTGIGRVGTAAPRSPSPTDDPLAQRPASPASREASPNALRRRTETGHAPGAARPDRPDSLRTGADSSQAGPSTATARWSPPPAGSSGRLEQVGTVVRGDEFIDPANHARLDEVARTLALRQCLAARKLFYSPGEVLRQQIGQAAEKTLDIVKNLSESDLKSLTRRLFSPAGLLAKKSPEVLVEMLGRLVEDSRLQTSCANAIDRTAFISLLGDIGGLYADAKKDSTSFSAEQKMSLLRRVSHLVEEAKLTPLSEEIVERVAQISAGTGVVGPRKKAERQRSDAQLPRTGLHDLGKEVDEKLGIPDQLQIPPVHWKPMRIKAARLLDTPEPLVAHMSGGPSEILMVWDMLCGKRGEEIYTAALVAQQHAIDSGFGSSQPMEHFDREEKNARLARVAGACAMLVGVGHHSAVEVAESALKYTGQDLRSVLDDKSTQDAAHLLGAGAATDLITELFELQTKN